MTPYRKIPLTPKSVRSRRAVTVLGLFATGAAVAIVVTVVSTLLSSSTQQLRKNSVDEFPLQEKFSIETDPLVVTDLRVVYAATDNAARDQCITLSDTSDMTATPSQWINAGKNLNSATTAFTATASLQVSDDAYAYLCMQQRRLASIQHALSSSLLSFSATNGSSRPVLLQSLHVFNAANCSKPLLQIFSPRNNVVLCAQTIDAATAIATGMYVSDVAATYERTYRNAVPGWTTEPTSVTVSSTATPPVPPTTLNEVYVSYKRPARPISAIRAVQDVASTNSSRACTSQLGNQWEQAGYVGISEGDVGSTNPTILCIERPVLTDVLSQNINSVLVDVAITNSTTACSDDYGERQNLSVSVALCGKFRSGADLTSYIVELRLQSIAENTTTPVIHTTFENDAYHVLPVSVADNGLSRLALVYRYHTGIAVTTPHGASALSVKTDAVTSSLVARAIPPPSSTSAPPSPTPHVAQALTFKIVQLADLHYTGDASHECRNPPQEMVDSGTICTEADTTAFVEKVLDAEKPDFVVFSGDNVEVLKGGSMSDAIKAMLGPAEARKIPYAVVFGNHDDENGQSRANMAQQIIGREFSHMQWGPTSVAGVGNYELSVNAPSDGPWGPAGSKVFQMYFLDSHGYLNTTAYPNVKSTYDWIKPDQVAYYKEMALANRNASKTSGNGSSPLPAVMFFHIPIPEYASVGSPKFRSGDKNENAASSEVQSNLFSALVEMGDVKATFVGHDHLNEYCFKRQDVQLCYGGGTGFAQAYGSAQYARRSRVIEWSVDAQNTRRIKSWKRHYGSAFDTRQHEEVLFDE